MDFSNVYFLKKYTSGHGVEFGEFAEHITDGVQVRSWAMPIDGKTALHFHPARIPFGESSLDYIVCLHYVEHFSNTKEIVSHWWNTLRKHGTLIVVLPQAGLYPEIGTKGANPDHVVDLRLSSFNEMLKSIGKFTLLDSGFDGDTFYLAVKKDDGEHAVINENMKYSVVIPIFNQHSMTEKCIDSIFAGNSPDEIIVVDDGSASRFSYNDDRVKVIKLKKNTGFPNAVNTGIKVAKNEFIAILNNDTLIEAGGLHRLVNALRDPLVGMAGQVGGKLNEDFSHAGKVYIDPDYIEMCICAVRKIVWERLGNLDAHTFGRGYSEDVDFCLKLKKNGYKLAIVPDCGTHLENKTFGRTPEVDKLIEKNRNILIQRYKVGKCLWVMESLGCNGGSKVVQKLASAMKDNGWNVDVYSKVGWDNACAGWEKFGHKDASNGIANERYDVVVSTYHSTMPFAQSVPCYYRFALIQSDEPEWKVDADAAANFKLSGFKSVIISSHMQEFKTKYGMDICGQIDNGVDGTVFYPEWTFERKWPHSLMLIRKNDSVWYDGQYIAEEAVRKLSTLVPDLSVTVLGGNRPNWPCAVNHVKTYDQNVIRGLLNNVSAMVVPSLIEGSSLVPLEAMSCGTPVVTTRVGVDYGIDHENCLFVDYKDADGVVHAVLEIFNDKKLAKKLSMNGLKVAQQRTWENEQKQFMDIINKVMGK